MKTLNVLIFIVLIFLALYKTIFLSFTYKSAFLGRKTYDVRIINGFTDNSSLPLVVWCASDQHGGDIGGRALQERDDYGWSVETSFFFFGSIRSICTVKWGGKRKKFDAFQVSRDVYKCGAYGMCFWLVKEDGFYFSNDGLRWIFDFPWT